MFESLENRRMFDGSVPNIDAIADGTQNTTTQHFDHENLLNDSWPSTTKARQMAGQDGQQS
jgi:hypothetical protein